MAARWSNPSGGLGIDRFRVWPLGSDSYTHADLAGNWDTLDGLIGVPSSGTWPPSTGIDGGIYKEIALLNDERTPIGTVVGWFRPNGATSIPTGWAACDGSTLTSAFHNFPGGGSVTLPDLRNRFILGANAASANGAAAAAVGDGTIDTSSGSPGPQASGGSNKIVQSTAQMPSHSHTFTGNPLNAHTHAFTGNALPTHLHRTVTNPTASNDDFVYFRNDLAGGGTNRAVADMGSYEPVGATHLSALIGVQTGLSTAGTPSGSISSTSDGTPTGSVSSAGSGSPMDNRPHWYGLIYICKVKYTTTI